MALPTELAMDALKRFGKYVVGRRRLVYRYHGQTGARVDTYSDTELAKCAKTPAPARRAPPPAAPAASHAPAPMQAQVPAQMGGGGGMLSGIGSTIRCEDSRR